MGISRRDFIWSGVAGMALMASCGYAGIDKGGKKPQIGVQLFSIKGIAGKNVPLTMKTLKEMGYAGVEFAGYYGKSAKELRKIIDDAGIKACGSHIKLPDLKPDRLNKTLEFNQELGNGYVAIPYLNAGNEKGWAGYADILNAAAEKAKAFGIRVGYHNHQHEFRQKIKGTCKYEIFWKYLSKSVFIQMDVGHVVSAGEDPVFWLRKIKDHQALTIHAKEIYPGPGILGRVPAGKKGVDWDALFPVLEREKGLQWYIVETEGNPNTFDKVRGCIEFLRKKGRC